MTGIIKDKRVPIFVIIFSVFLILFENSIFNIISLNQAKLLESTNPVVKFEIIKNYGASWGILQNSRLFLITFGIAAVILALYYGIKNFSFENKIEVLSLALFLSGTLGNLIERIRFGYVLDYIKPVFIDFPTFNIFDVCIVLSVSLFIILSLKTKRSAK